MSGRSELTELPDLGQITPEQASYILADLEGYIRPPADIDRFLDDPLYLGFLGKKIYPTWREVLREVYPNPFESPYYELAIGGAIGLGKTTIARIMLLYDLHKLLLLRDPHKKFGLIETDYIIIALFTADLTLADRVLYGPFRELIKRSPFFSSRVLKGLDKGSIEFPNKILILAGSRFRHALGQAVVSGLIDEANFGMLKSQVEESYTAISRRMKSRFLQKGGRLPGHLILVSSEKEENSWLNSHIERSKSEPGFKSYSFAIWEVKKHLGIYSFDNTFKVFCGSATLDPFIIETDEDMERIPEEERDRIIEVPIELYTEFKKDLVGAIRDLAGRSTISSNRFIRDVAPIINAAKMKNPFKKDVIQLSMSGDDTILDFAVIEYFRRPIDRTQPRFIHIDLGLVEDRTGIAASYISGTKKVTRFDPSTGDYVSSTEPVITTDFAIAVEALPGQEVPIWKIRQFIHEIRKLGYPVAIVTLDGFQSRDTMQLLVKQGIPSKLLSVDRSTDPYRSAKSALLENRWVIPNNRLLLRELRYLEDHGNKIDHPQRFPDANDPRLSRGTKDVADAAVGSYWLAIQEGSSYFLDAFQEEKLAEELSVDDLFNKVLEEERLLYYDGG